MFMFCRLAMMKEFLFMSGLEQPSHTHTHTPRPSATHTHTHTLLTPFTRWDLPDEHRSPLLPWWTIGCGGQDLWYVTLLINAYMRSCERLLLFPSSVTVVSLALFLSLWAICLAWFFLSYFFFLCGDWDYDVIYSCWGSHARSLRYLPHFPAEETSSDICCVSDAGELTRVFN